MSFVTFGTKTQYYPLGQGTWCIGNDPSVFAHEVQILQEGVRHNLAVIDTAAMYAEGGAERVVARAIQPYRRDVFVVTKVWPTNASKAGVISSLKNSLRRLETSHVDLFLLHWPSAHYPLRETMGAMATVYEEGLTKAIGVSNFNVDLLKQAQKFLGPIPLVANQIEYSLMERAAEVSVIPYCQDHNITIMAYSPIKRLNSLSQDDPKRQVLRQLARQYATTEHVIALTWVIRQSNIIAIPKTSQYRHLSENILAFTLKLSSEDEERLDMAFPRPPHDLSVQWL